MFPRANPQRWDGDAWLLVVEREKTVLAEGLGMTAVS